MIEKMKQLFNNFKNNLIKSRIDNCFYSSSISTSCSFPILSIERKIWRISVFCSESFQLENIWAESEDELNNIISVLELYECFYDYESYIIKIR
jgi:hypothetical protein